jgi:hypothetical protein
MGREAEGSRCPDALLTSKLSSVLSRTSVARRSLSQRWRRNEVAQKGWQSEASLNDSGAGTKDLTAAPSDASPQGRIRGNSVRHRRREMACRAEENVASGQ